MYELMIDLETMSTEPNAAIVSIGACAFDIAAPVDEPIPEHHCFYRSIQIDSNEKHGRHLCAGTMLWWLKQSREAQQALYTPPLTPLKQALVEFRLWGSNLTPPVAHIWANDPDFDVVIMKSAFEAVGDRWPFQFWNNRSCRTIKWLAYPENNCPDFMGTGVAHNAMDDAVKQARMVRHCYQVLMNGAARQSLNNMDMAPRPA